MPTTPDAEDLGDRLAASAARALATANRRAIELGFDVAQRFVTVSQKPRDHQFVWEIQYIPRDYVSRRGGDFTIEIDPDSGGIRRELRGQ